MTASAANGFAQVKYDPTGSSCTAIPITSIRCTARRPPRPAYLGRGLLQRRVRHRDRPFPVLYRAPTRSRPPRSASIPRAIPPCARRATRRGRGSTPAAGRRRHLLLPRSEALVYKVAGCPSPIPASTALPTRGSGRTATPGTSGAVPVHQPPDRPELRGQYQASRVRDRPASHRIHLRSEHRRGLHADPADDGGRQPFIPSTRRPGPRWLRLAVRQRHPRRNSGISDRTLSTARCSSSPIPSRAAAPRVVPGLPAQHDPNPCPRS